MSKGSKQRPVDKKAFDKSFDRIFGKPKPCGKTLPGSRKPHSATPASGS